jgi:hypothetical protein
MLYGIPENSTKNLPKFFLFFFLFSLLAINYSRNIRNTILVFVNLDAVGVPPPSQTRAIHISHCPLPSFWYYLLNLTHTLEEKGNFFV